MLNKSKRFKLRRLKRARYAKYNQNLFFAGSDSMIYKYNLKKYMAGEDEACRLVEIQKHSYRSVYQRDRDRILYSKEFRRLSGKTQIFVAGSDDHVRTRLTHTLEVAQIAETIAGALNLNSVLATAMAYGHDVGHTPFGHVGERTLNFIMNGCFEYYGYNEGLQNNEKGFKHNYQGIRVTEFLEELDGSTNAGLNLTKYTLWGILNHTKTTYKKCEYYSGNGTCRYKNCNKRCDGSLSLGFYEDNLKFEGKPLLNDRRDWTLEGIIVAFADEIAQRHHDIEDGIFAGVINVKHLCDYLLADEVFGSSIGEGIRNLKDSIHKKTISRHSIITTLSRIIVDFYVTSFIDLMKTKVDKLNTDLNCDCSGHEWREKAYDYIRSLNMTPIEYFCFEEKMKEADKRFGKYLGSHIINSELAQSMDGKASFIIKRLFKAYLTNPQQLPDRTIISIVDDWNHLHNVVPTPISKYKTRESDSRDRLKYLLNENDNTIKKLLLRRICDYIAGMTDQYALDCFEKLYGTSGYRMS